MKKILNVSQNSTGVDIAILVARLGIGSLMLVHGLPKMANLFSGDPIQFPSVMGLSSTISLALAVFAEVLCSILLIAGFRTRLAVVPLIITMLVALISIHGSDAFAKQEPAIHYLLVYVVLLFAGSGKFSLDYVLQNTKADNRKSIAGTQAVAFYQ